MTTPATEMGIEPLVERVARALCYELPCDVKLPPATTVKAGCKLETLLLALSLPGRPREFEATRTPEAAQVVREAAEPWADYHGDIPDYDHPLRPVFESGIQYAVELLAKMLGVDDWEICDGTEEFDGDLGGTLLNIVIKTWPTDEHGDWIDLRDPETRAALAQVRHPSGEQIVMSAPAFTPGPWRVGKPGPNLCPTVGTMGGLMAAMVTHGDGHPTQANARLIAAAPELYEALDEAICLVPASQRAALAKFNAALAKARGEQS